MDANSIELKIDKFVGENYLMIKPMNKNSFNNIDINNKQNQLKPRQIPKTRWNATTQSNRVVLNIFLKNIAELYE